MGWLIALGILVLLALMPLGVKVLYNAQGFSMKLIAGPVRIPLLPRKYQEEQPEKQEKKKKKASSKEESEEEGGSWKDFLPLIKTGLSFLNGLRQKLRVKRLEMKLVMAGEDPYELAMNYGRTNVALGTLWPLLETCFVIKKRNVKLRCDFDAEETVITFRADITITLARLLVLVVRYGVRAYKQYKELQNIRKGGAQK